MSFGPLIKGSSGGGGGGGGLAIVEATVSTGNVAAGGDVDISLPLPAGVTGVAVLEIEVTRTAGTATAFGIEVFADDARVAGIGFLAGGAFDSISIGADPVYGPSLYFSGAPQTVSVPYKNRDGSEFLRATFSNIDGVNAGTFDVTLHMLPVS